MGAGLLTDFDLHLLTEGAHYRSYRKLGAHPQTVGGIAGVNFAVRDVVDKPARA